MPACEHPDHELCGVCGDCLRKGRYVDIRVEQRDDAGEVVYDQETGELKHVLVPLPVHVLHHSRLDPTGLVGVVCGHGLPAHPDPEVDQEHRRRGALTFVRSRYTVAWGPNSGRCVVDEGQPRPDDLTTARA